MNSEECDTIYTQEQFPFTKGVVILHDVLHEYQISDQVVCKWKTIGSV